MKIQRALALNGQECWISGEGGEFVSCVREKLQDEIHNIFKFSGFSFEKVQL